MEKWTEYFDTTAERRHYIKDQRKKAKEERKKLHVLKRSYIKWRCADKITYFADFAKE